MTLTAKEKRSQASYVDKFLKLNCAVDLLPIFNDRQHAPLKEITESWGMYQAVINHIRRDVDNPNVNVVVIGDGCTPRTGALFAFLTKWSVLSIDPNFRKDNPFCGVQVNKLHLCRCRLEDVMPTNYARDVIIVMPHAHADANIALEKIKTRGMRSLVVCPCCHPDKQLPQTSSKTSAIYYRDKYVLSEQNHMFVYKHI